MSQNEKINLNKLGKKWVETAIKSHYPTAKMVTTSAGKKTLFKFQLKPNSTILEIEVHVKKDKEWPMINGVGLPTMILILVDYERKNAQERPDFYLLNQIRWKLFLQEVVIPNPKVKKIQNEYLPIWEDGTKGTCIRIENVAKWKESWQILETE